MIDLDEDLTQTTLAFLKKLKYPPELDFHQPKIEKLVSAILHDVSSDPEDKQNLNNLMAHFEAALDNPRDHTISAIVSSLSAHSQSYFELNNWYLLSSRLLDIVFFYTEKQNLTANRLEDFFTALREALTQSWTEDKQKQVDLKNMLFVAKQLLAFYADNQNKLISESLFSELLTFYSNNPSHWKAIVKSFALTFEDKTVRESYLLKYRLIKLNSQLKQFRTTDEKSATNSIIDEYHFQVMRAVSKASVKDQDRSALVRLGKLMEHWFSGKSIDIVFRDEYLKLGRELSVLSSKVKRAIGITLIILGLLVAVGSIIALAVAMSSVMAGPALLASVELIKSFAYYTIVAGSVAALGGLVLYKVGLPEMAGKVYTEFRKVCAPLAPAEKRLEGDERGVPFRQLV